MKYLNALITFFVGSLFIFSGLIKINDPVGTAIKLEEYFEVFAEDRAQFNLAIFHGLWEALVPTAIYLAIFLCVVEVVLGVALLVNYRKRLVINLLLLIIVFFTFLTFYSAYFNKVTDCGCFGDAIKLTPWQSFAKDIVLLVLIGVLFFQKSKFSNTQNRWSLAATALATLLSTGIALYALNFLPPIDFRAYKVGNHIPTLMKPAAPCQYLYVMEKDGKTYEMKDYPTDKAYTFKQMITLNEEECKAKITDYSVWNQEGDFTQETFKGAKLLIIVHDLKGKTYMSNTNLESYDKIATLLTKLKGVEPIVLTSANEKAFELFRHEKQIAAPYYFADATVLKTMIRSNPGLVLLKDGKVKAQWHYHSVPTAEEVLAKN